jgi:tetratricopeptide (TPR) repeat protein
VGLFLLGGLLANHYYSAREDRARASYALGTELVRQHRDVEAVEAFRTALSLVHNDQYHLALGLALARSGRDAEARVYLSQVLNRQPDNGPANLALARLQLRLEDTPGAIASYRRAVSGVWPTDGEQDRTDAAFELADLLEKTGDRRQAEAELLRESGRTSTPEVLTRAGRGLLRLGSYRAAADVFREVVAASPQSAAGYVGLGDALLAGEDYREASRAFHRALELDTGNKAAQDRATLCDEVLSLDPNAGGLSRGERFERSRRLLTAVLQVVDACAASPERPEGSLLASARREAAVARKPADLRAATEANIDTAERVWAGTPPRCAAPGSAVVRVMARLRR